MAVTRLTTEAGDMVVATIPGVHMAIMADILLITEVLMAADIITVTTMVTMTATTDMEALTNMVTWITDITTAMLHPPIPLTGDQRVQIIMIQDTGVAQLIPRLPAMPHDRMLLPHDRMLL